MQITEFLYAFLRAVLHQGLRVVRQKEKRLDFEQLRVPLQRIVFGLLKARGGIFQDKVLGQGFLRRFYEDIEHSSGAPLQYFYQREQGH